MSLFDPTNYGYPTPLSGGILHTDVTRWRKIDKTLPGPLYVVSKTVCWEDADETKSPYVNFDNGYGMLTKGNVQYEKEMLQWASDLRLGPILYDSLDKSDCSMFVIQYFDTTLQDLNAQFTKLKYTLDQVYELYQDLFDHAYTLSRTLEHFLSEEKVFMDLQPANMAVDLAIHKLVILDWGPAGKRTRVCWGGVLYDTLLEQYTKFLDMLAYIPPPPFIELLEKAEARLVSLEFDNEERVALFRKCLNESGVLIQKGS